MTNNNLQDERERFEAALSTKPEARHWNTTDAMFWAWQAALASAEQAEPVAPVNHPWSMKLKTWNSGKEGQVSFSGPYCYHAEFPVSGSLMEFFRYVEQLFARPAPSAVVEALRIIADDTEDNSPPYRGLGSPLRVRQIAREALALIPPEAEQPATDESERHIANEWADVACNGLDWLRNVRNVPENVDWAIADMEENIARIRAIGAEQPAAKNEVQALDEQAKDAAPEIGDYVLTTKWSDGDPGDHWGVGFYDGFRNDRHFVKDGAGNQIRAGGFRRVGPISPDTGRWLLENARELESAPGPINLWELVAKRGG